ncbi:MAG: hypothetical protein ACE5KI_03715 [Dehalococcoidia bacterium]
MPKIARHLWGIPLILCLVLAIAAASCTGREGETLTPSPSPTEVLPEVSPSPTGSPTTAPTEIIEPTPLALEPYLSLAHGVSLSIPQGWVVDDGDPEVLRVSNPAGVADIEIRMNTFLAVLTLAQFDEYVSLGILALRNEFPNFQEISRERLEEPPRLMISFLSESSGIETGVVALYTYNNVRGALALASTDAAVFDLFLPLFEEAVKSLRVQPNPPGPTPTPSPTPIPPPPTSTPFPTVTPGVYTDPTYDFTMDLPSGWGILDPGKEAVVRFIGPGGIIVQVLTAEIPSNMSNQLYALVLQENRYEPLSGYQRGPEENITLGNLGARQLEFTAGTGESVDRYLVLVTSRGIRAYIIEAIAPQAAFEALETEIETFVKSFRP